ncbi:MAG: acetylornithine transaminase [bacterium]|nr:acetylornithine transaminase [bacterium]
MNPPTGTTPATTDPAPPSPHALAVGALGDAERCPLMPSYGPPQVMFVRGSGARLWDREEREYLDFLSGLAVTSLGHSHPRVAEALATQAQRLLHVSNLFATEHNGPVAQTLDGLLGGGGQVFFCNSGAEANEAAIKLARRWAGWGRHTVISTLRSFHGRTLATLHATGQPEKHEVFQPLPEGFRHVPFADVAAVSEAVDETTAAILVEPIQGEGGVNVPPESYLPELRALCDERGLLLMFDEVQTGLARTGRWFAHQHSGVSPDVVTMAKALGNGVPIGACWARADVAGAFRPGDHATTFGGQPLATAAARAVLDCLIELDAPVAAAAAGTRLQEGLEALAGVVGVRGRGLLLAAELDPAIGRTAAEVAAGCLAAGLVVNAITPSAVRFAPPLVVTDDEIDEALVRFAAALADPAPETSP